MTAVSRSFYNGRWTLDGNPEPLPGGAPVLFQQSFEKLFPVPEIGLAEPIKRLGRRAGFSEGKSVVPVDLFLKTLFAYRLFDHVYLAAEQFG